MSCFSQFSDNNNNNNNNNYIPSVYGDMPSLSHQQFTENASRTRTFGAPHNFTFSYPTQGTTIPTPRPSIQTTSSMPFVGALGPGLGTTWQHSNPSSIVTHTSSHLTSPVFTGMPPRSEPQPSCSSPIKRPKRKAEEYSEDAPSSKVYLCTDQFANLNINNDIVQHEIKGHDPVGWGRFQEVENSIVSDEDEGSAEDKKKGVLHINDAITDAISSQSASNILPTDVLKEIAGPCMQIVLWKSPGELVRDLVREDSINTPPPSPSPSTMHSMSTSSMSTPLNISSVAFENSSNFMLSSNCHSSTVSTPSNHTWLHQNISNTPLTFSQYSSSQLPIQTSTQPQSEWNLSSSSRPNTLLMSQENIGVWDDNIDLNSMGNYDEEMQL